MAIDSPSPLAPDQQHRSGMIGSILDLSVRYRWAVVVIAFGVAIWGAFNLARLPIDAVPDITNVQVQINTEAPALSPSQIETQVTFPVETGMAGTCTADIESLRITKHAVALLHCEQHGIKSPAFTLLAIAQFQAVDQLCIQVGHLLAILQTIQFRGLWCPKAAHQGEVNRLLLCKAIVQ